MVDIQVNDVIVDSGIMYVVTYVDENSKTIDIKCCNQPCIYRAVPIDNLDQDDVKILKSVPENIKFLFRKS